MHDRRLPEVAFGGRLRAIERHPFDLSPVRSPDDRNKRPRPPRTGSGPHRRSAGEGARACLTVYADAARLAADAADARARAGISLGALDGALVSIKDLFDVAGEVTRAGSRMLAEEGKPAAADAPVVRAAARGRRGHRRQDQHDRVRLLTASAPIRISARRATVPTASACRAAPPPAARSRSPTRCARSPSAATPVARPAFRPRSAASSAGSRGGQRIPREGAFPLSFALDSIGPMARSVADCVVADAVMAGESRRRSSRLRSPACASAVRRGAARGYGRHRGARVREGARQARRGGASVRTSSSRCSTRWCR